MKQVYLLEIERDEPLTEEEMMEAIDSYALGASYELEYLGSREDLDESDGEEN